VRYPLWMRGRVGDGRHSYITGCKQREPRQSQLVCYRLQVEYLGVERKVRYVACGEAGSSGVVPDQLHLACQAFEPAPVLWDLPLQVNVGKGKRRHLNERRPLAKCPVGDAQPVGCRGILNARFHGATILRHPPNPCMAWLWVTETGQARGDRGPALRGR